MLRRAERTIVMSLMAGAALLGSAAMDAFAQNGPFTNASLNGTYLNVAET